MKIVDIFLLISLTQNKQLVEPNKIPDPYYLEDKYN